ncbi:unnamed protein product, partial [Prunus brigantina]
VRSSGHQTRRGRYQNDRAASLFPSRPISAVGTAVTGRKLKKSELFFTDFPSLRSLSFLHQIRQMRLEK